MAATERHIVQFVPFVSRLGGGFWHELSRRKLEKYHLSEAARDVSGHYANSKDEASICDELGGNLLV